MKRRLDWHDGQELTRVKKEEKKSSDRKNRKKSGRSAWANSGPLPRK